MKQIKPRKNKSLSMLSGKGFYISLGVCLLAIGATAFFAVSRTGDILNGETAVDLSSAAVSMNEWGFPQNADANQSGWSVASSERERSSSISSSSKKSSAKRANAKAQASSSKSAQLSFSMPLAGDVINPYSKGELVKSKTMNDWRTHDGVDIAGAIAAPVKSAADGEVADIVNDELWGVTIIVDHGDGYLAKYCGMNTNVSVKKHQEIKKGDVIGSVGNTSQYERDSAPHLHFCMMKNDKYIDPLSVIK